MNEVNIAVMNQTIKRFSIVNREMPIHNLSYKEQKIQHILQAVEMEMDSVIISV